MLHDFCCLSLLQALQNFPDMICFILKIFFLASYQFQGQLSETVTPRKKKKSKNKISGRGNGKPVRQSSCISRVDFS